MDSIKKKIDGMSHTAMARLWRFAPASKPMFTSNKQDDLELQEYFAKKFMEKGGMNQDISKAIGWDDIIR